MNKALLDYLSNIPIKKPQLIGIICGILVFILTIIVVLYLLYKGGILTGAMREIQGEITEKDLNNKKKLLKLKGLHDHLLKKARELSLKPLGCVDSLQGIKVMPFSVREHSIDLLAASDGRAIFHESSYHAFEYLWQWIDLSPTVVCYIGSAETCLVETNIGEMVGIDNRINENSGPSSINNLSLAPDCTRTPVFTETIPALKAEMNSLASDFEKDSPCVSLYWPTALMPCANLTTFCAWFEHAPSDALHMTIHDAELGKAIGMFTLACHRPYDLSVRLCNIWVSPAYRASSACTSRIAGTYTHLPFAQIAVYLILRHLFDAGYRRVTAEVSSANIPALKFMKKCGFSVEGVMRKHRIVHGCNQDTTLYALLNSEWPDVKRAFDLRLGLVSLLPTVTSKASSSVDSSHLHTASILSAATQKKE